MAIRRAWVNDESKGICYPRGIAVTAVVYAVVVFVKGADSTIVDRTGDHRHVRVGADGSFCERVEGYRDVVGSAPLISDRDCYVHGLTRVDASVAVVAGVLSGGVEEHMAEVRNIWPRCVGQASTGVDDAPPPNGQLPHNEPRRIEAFVGELCPQECRNARHDRRGH